MKIRILEQLHISSVSADTLRPGAEVEVSDDQGNELLKRHPDKVAEIEAEIEGEGEGESEAKPAAKPEAKAAKAPANKAAQKAEDK